MRCEMHPFIVKNKDLELNIIVYKLSPHVFIRPGMHYQ